MAAADASADFLAEGGEEGGGEGAQAYFVARPGSHPFRRKTQIDRRPAATEGPPLAAIDEVGDKTGAGTRAQPGEGASTPAAAIKPRSVLSLGEASTHVPATGGDRGREQLPPWEDAMLQAQRWMRRATEAHERQVFELQSEVARLSGRSAPASPAASLGKGIAAVSAPPTPTRSPTGGSVGFAPTVSQGMESVRASVGTESAVESLSETASATPDNDVDGAFDPAGRPALSFTDDSLHFSVKDSLKGFWKSQLAGSGKSVMGTMVSGISSAKLQDKTDQSRKQLDEDDPAHELGIWRYFISAPSSRWRLVWDLMGSFFLFLDLVMIPMQAFGRYINNESTPMMTLAYATSCYWTADFVLSFFVGYHVKGVVEMRPWHIAAHYLRTWFILDCSLVTVDWCFIFMGLGQQASAFRTGKTMSRCMRVLRLLRIVKMHSVVSDILERIRSEYVRTVFQICTLVFFIVIINHISACVWYGITYMVAEDEITWVKTFLRESDSLSYRYATSLHWSLTQFTPAGMEVYAKNELERVYSVCLLLFALITFSSFVSSITNLMNHLRSINAQRLEQQKKLRLYLHQHGISSLLVNRVWHYLHHREVLNSVKTRTKEADVPVLTLLPASMRAELRYEAFSKDLQLHPFFFHYGFVEKGALLQICDSAVDEVSLLARAELFSTLKGEAVKMFFVIEGTFEYSLPCHCWDNRNSVMSGASSEDDQANEPQLRWNKDELGSHALARAARSGRARIRPGQWCCEAALWVPEVHLASPFVASGKTEIIVINTGEFQKIVSMYSMSRLKVARYAETFVDHMPSMSKCRWLCCMCNDFSEIEDLVHRVFDYTEAVEAAPTAAGKRSTRMKTVRRASVSLGSWLETRSSGASARPASSRSAASNESEAQI